jgi:hypothetical protein
MMKDGISDSDFGNFIQSMPDKGQGIHIGQAGSTFRAYVTPINATEAQQASQNPLVDLVILNANIDDDGFGTIPRSARQKPSLERSIPRQSLNPRALPPPPSNNLVQQIGFPNHLKVVSQSQQNSADGVLNNYMFDPIAGQGITIYIIDTVGSPLKLTQVRSVLTFNPRASIMPPP